MLIVNCDVKDIDLLTRFYDWGRELQQQRSNRHWKEFDHATVLKEIEEKRLWKVIDNSEVYAVFLSAYEDPFIWGERGKEPAVYLHRIVSHPAHRGKGLMKHIVNWAIDNAKEKGMQFVRMDTWGDNPALAGYYVSCGFRLIGIVTPENTSSLPAHYDCISLSLLEMKVE